MLFSLQNPDKSPHLIITGSGTVSFQPNQIVQLIIVVYKGPY